jgi:hypothetical protein
VRRSTRQTGRPSSKETGPVADTQPGGRPTHAQLDKTNYISGLRRRHRRLEQHPAVDRQPAPIKGLDLVRDRDVGVQIRVPGPGVSVGKGGGHEASDVDLPNPVSPLSGEQGVALDEGQRILHSSLMGEFDLCGDVRVGDRP